MPHLLWHKPSQWSSPRSRDTCTCCRAFSSAAVTSCFYDLGLSRLGFEQPTSRMQDERSNRRIVAGKFNIHILYTYTLCIQTNSYEIYLWKYNKILPYVIIENHLHFQNYHDLYLHTRWSSTCQLKPYLYYILYKDILLTFRR